MTARGGLARVTPEAIRDMRRRLRVRIRQRSNRLRQQVDQRQHSEPEEHTVRGSPAAEPQTGTAARDPGHRDHDCRRVRHHDPAADPHHRRSHQQPNHPLADRATQCPHQQPSPARVFARIRRRADRLHLRRVEPEQHRACGKGALAQPQGQVVRGAEKKQNDPRARPSGDRAIIDPSAPLAVLHDQRDTEPDHAARNGPAQ
ncbi:MAG: hypothetical protein ACYSXF_10535, partial [Planctomycetota bacterium]